MNNGTANIVFSGVEPKAITEEEKAHEHLVNTATRIVELQAKIKNDTDELNTLRQDIIDTNGIGTFDADRWKVIVRKGAHDINTKLFIAAFPFENYPELYKHTPDTTKAHKELDPQQLSSVSVTRKPTVVVSEAME